MSLSLSQVTSILQIASEKRDRAIIGAQTDIIVAHETYGKDLELALKAAADSGSEPAAPQQEAP